MNKKRARSAVVIYAIILIVGFLLINKWLGGSSNVATNYSYTEFSADLNAGNIATVDITQNTNVPTATVDVEFVSGNSLHSMRQMLMRLLRSIMTMKQQLIRRMRQLLQRIR